MVSITEKPKFYIKHKFPHFSYHLSVVGTTDLLSCRQCATSKCL